MKLLLLFCAFLVACQAHSFQELRQGWTFFKAEHNKNYNSPVEEQRRLGIYLKNLNMINEHNARYAKGEVSYTVAMNQFGDLTSEEFLIKMGLNHTLPVSERMGQRYVSAVNAQVPATINWKDKGAVTPVKNQGACGSCWSFSSTGAIEGQHFLKTGKLVSLSEQNLVDCTTANYGCGGGWMDAAFQYVIKNGGIDTEESYPYEATQRTCRYKASGRGATLSSLVDIQAGNEGQLKEATANIGPIAVAFDASRPTFQFYSKGVYYDSGCATNRPTHAVLIVGYGTEGNQDYWLVKNSWGEGWGNRGYFEIARNKNSHCGIANWASYPVV